jgi:DNA-binding SARP family transcriptional activator
MQFQLLGPLRVIGDDGAEVSIRQPRERALLAVLLLNTHRVTHTPHLIDLLWGDDVPACAAGALRTHIWSLRRLLAPAQRLCHVPGGYRLEVLPGELDLETFRRLAEQGARALDCGDNRDADLLLSRALRLWREPPLADVPTTAALQGPVRKLLEQRRAVHESLITVRFALGQHWDLLSDLEEQTSAHPEDEWYWERLMVALYRCGRRAEALGAYRHVQAILAEKHGIDPGPGLQRIHRQILDDDPALGWPAAFPQ